MAKPEDRTRDRTFEEIVSRVNGLVRATPGEDAPEAWLKREEVLILAEIRDDLRHLVISQDEIRRRA